MTNWQEQRRADRLVAAQVRREEAAAAAQVRIAERAAEAQLRRADADARAARRQQAKEQRSARLRAVAGAVRGWLGTHVVELLIYPIALLSFVLAAPAMAAYGQAVFGTGAGMALPGLTELGMWAFAVAVVISRRREPHRPTGGLQTGVWVFAAVAFALNFVHGLAAAWDHGVVMGIASIAGVVAHQLTLAAPRRSRIERQTARIERAAARKITRVRRAAVRQAVAEIDRDGAARLVYAPGRYVLARRGRLEQAIVPGLPVSESADWDRELADLLTIHGTGSSTSTRGGIEPDPAPGDSVEGGTVATLDREPEQHKSTPDRPRRTTSGGRKVRSIEQLRAELARAIRTNPDRVDPTSAESIRKALRCSPKNARQLRDEHRQGGDTR
ncbi:hypothetical protein SAMN05421835_108182 [Amycolatopsis sacchari]|uniref:DUF2637 domain-containing protein n=1 Tax=Amycolatopsis sacchari TaxID=115433 RepID=A0A1I3U0V3_9PSEU|nr:hypothetical protein [Amycolatopsis sacchari]SFJ76590.1 hypothetical protein SAMN05421835_108182 [Amycolatopsis sacchari]